MRRTYDRLNTHRRDHSPSPTGSGLFTMQMSRLRSSVLGTMSMFFVAVALLPTPGIAAAASDTLESSTPSVAGAVEVGYRDHDFGMRVHKVPTAEKPESKLWWNDDTWWGCLWDADADTYRIYRLDTETQSWISVGPNVDNRSNTVVDVLWDGVYLYILSHEHEGPQATMLWSYGYGAGTGTYTLRPGFPISVNSSGPEAATIAKDTTGKLWVTWEQDEDIMVTCSTTSDLAWREPFRLPVQGEAVTGDDISVVTSFAGKVGILWSNQSVGKIYFATHVDGQPDTNWGAREEALADPGLPVADDHLNVAIHGDAVYAVTKTSLSLATDPGVYLIRRDAAGTWTRHVVALKSDDYTRPCVLIDDENDEIHVFALCSNGDDAIRRKSSSLSAIDFAVGLGEVFIQSDVDRDINDPTSTKQNVNGRTNLLVLASDFKTDHYLHNYLDLPGGAGEITVVPASYDFADVPVDSSTIHTFTLRNDGAFDLTVTSTTIVGVDSTAFAIESGGGAIVLGPGAAQDVVVRFGPTEPGTLIASLQIVSDDPDEATLDVAVSGVGVEPDITVTPTALGYPMTAVGQRVARSVELRNDGNSDLEVHAASITGADSADFSIDTPAAPVLLGAAESHHFIISFRPDTHGTKSATLRMTSNDPDEPSVDVALSGIGLGPDIAIASSAYDFGSVRTGRDSTSALEIRNDGNADLSVTSVSVSGADSTLFTVDSTAFVIAPGDSYDVGVRFQPDRPGIKSTTLRVVSNDPVESVYDVVLYGTGIEPNIVVTPATHDYGIVRVGQSAVHAVSVQNDGSADLRISSTALAGADASRFGIDSGGGAFVLAAGDSSALIVRFSPDSLGIRGSVLQIASDDPDQAVVDVALTGSGGLPDIALTPTTLGYGEVVVGDSLLRTFEVRNDGFVDLNVASTTIVGTDSTLFSLDSGGGAFTLAPGEVHGLVVGFKPDSSRARSATLRILSDDPDTSVLDAALSGTGVQPVVVVAPAAFDFGGVLVGQHAVQAFELRNQGTADLHVTSTMISGIHSTTFGIDSGMAPFTLAPGDSANVVVRFLADSLGVRTATLRIASNDADRPIVDVALSGAGLLPDITLTPESYDFGSLAVGDSLLHTFEVRNDGSADLTVVSATITGADSTRFEIDAGAGAFALPPGATRDIVVRFIPDSHGFRNAVLEIASDDPDEGTANVSISGTGLAPLLVSTPPSHDYGGVWVGQAATWALAIHNEGNADLSVTSTSLAGPDSTLFSIEAGGDPFVLAPGDSSELVVRFTPDSLGSRTARLQIASDDPRNPLLGVDLAGSGVLPAISLTPAAHDYGDVVVGDSAPRSFEIRNDGSADLSVASTTIVGADSTQFSVASGGGAFTLPPGTTRDLVVHFNPDSSGTWGAALRIVSDDPAQDVVEAVLSGAGVQPRMIVTPWVVDFDRVLVGESALRTVELHNAGTSDLHLESLAFTGSDSTDFVLVSGSAPAVVSPDSTHQVLVRFVPSDVFTRGAFLRIASDDPDSALTDVTLFGTGLMPKLAIAPVGHDYGGVRVGQDSERTFHVSNGGNIDLNVATMAVTGSGAQSFTIDSGHAPFGVAPGDTHDVVVRFAPDSLDVQSATLQLTSNMPGDSLGVALSGVGVAPSLVVVPAVVDYGPVLVGQDSVRALRVQNVGTDDLNVWSTILTGPDSTSFDIESGGGPFALEPGGARDVMIHFAADSTVVRAAMLRIESDDFDTPILDVALSGVGVEPDIEVSQLAHDYGDVVRGQSVTKSLLVRNDGTSNLNVSSIQSLGPNSSAFSIEQGGAPFAIGPGDSNEVFVRFQPDSLGPYVAELQIVSDDPDEEIVKVVLTGFGVAPSIVVAPAGFDYGSIPLGQDSIQTFELWNDGTADLEVTSTFFVGNDSTMFFLDSGGNAFSVAPGDRQTIVVRFAPSLPGSLQTSLRIVSSDPLVPVLDVALNGFGTSSMLRMAPSTHDFGDVAVGASETQAFELHNDGTVILNVTSATIVGADSTLFAVDPGNLPFALAPLDSHQIFVRFDPDSLAVRNAILRVLSDDPVRPQLDVPLTGTGISPQVPQIVITPTVFDFGSVTVNSSATHAFELRNVGTGELEIVSTTLHGVGTTSFRIVSGGGARTLLPGEIHFITLRFHPVRSGTKEAILSITNNDPHADLVDIAVSGNATPQVERHDQHMLEEVTSGFASHSIQVSTAKVEPDGTAERFVAVVVVDEVRPVASVTGLGLPWVHRSDGLARQDGTHTEVWIATGTPTRGSVTATFSETAHNALIAVVGDPHGDASNLLSDERSSGATRETAIEQTFDGATRPDPRTIFMEIAKVALVQATARPSELELQESTAAPRTTSLTVASQDGIPILEVATPVPARAYIAVHDVRGRLVGVLWTGHMTVGRHRLDWDILGSRPPAGVYFIRAEIGPHVLTRKVLLAH